MKLGKNKLAVALGAVLSFGIAGQASADVYGLSSLQVDNLVIDFSAFGGAQLFTFSTNQDAALNGVADPTSGAASCFGNFQTAVNNCGAGTPRLSGTVQNAPGGGVNRAENDYTTKFGQVAEYSNAEAAIIQAVILGDFPTQASAISESNLKTGTTAQANTNVSSNTFLQLEFAVTGESTFAISFDAIIDVLAQVTGADAGYGLAQANSSLSVTLADANGNTIASWSPNGSQFVQCGAGLTCTAIESALNLQNTATSFGAPNGTNGSGSYSLEVEGLVTGNYSLALNTTTSTDLVRTEKPPVPIPGTLLLLGTGLLVGARTLRRNKK